jgi:hypothetical protein
VCVTVCRWCVTVSHGESRCVSRCVTAGNGVPRCERCVSRRSRCVTVCHSESRCVTVCHYVSRCVTMCHGVSRCVTVCHGVSRCVTVCHGVCHCVSWLVSRSVTVCHGVCHSVSWFVSRCVTVCHGLCHGVSRCVTVCHGVSRCVMVCVTECHGLCHGVSRCVSRTPRSNRFAEPSPGQNAGASESQRHKRSPPTRARGAVVGLWPLVAQGGTLCRGVCKGGGGTCMASAPAARHAGPDGRRPGIRVRAGKRRSARSLHAGAEAKQDVAGPDRVRVGRRGITGRSDRDPLVLQRFLVTPWLLESRYPLPRAGPGRPDASSTAGAGSAGPADHRPSQPRRETAIDLKTVRLTPRARTVRAIEAERGRSLGGGWHDCGSDCPGPTAHVEETDPGGAIT